MVTVEILCPCGQHYSIPCAGDDGDINHGVHCPKCGEVTVMSLAMPGDSQALFSPVAQDGAGAPSTLSADERRRAEKEARAKVFWGDSPMEVINYLTLHGFSPLEASGLARMFHKERLATLRARGARRFLYGAALVGAACLSWLFTVEAGAFRVLVIIGLLGLWGGWLSVTGLLTAVAPRPEPAEIFD